MKHRDRSLDIAKGICMICMILVHSFSWWNRYPGFNNYTGIFFLVFFFFASGICFKKVGWKEYIIKRFKRLLVPYGIYCGVYTLYMWQVRGFFNGMGKKHSIALFIVNTIESLPVTMKDVSFFHMDTYGVGTVWFVNCIFVANMLYRTVCSNKFRFPICVVGAIVATISQQYILLPFNIQDALIGCMFMAMGDCGRDIYKKIRKFLLSDKYFLQCLLAIVSVALYVFIVGRFPYQWINLGQNLYNFQSLPACILGFLLVILLATFIERTAIFDEFLEIYGKGSMFILVMHSADILMVRNWTLVNWQFIAVTLMGYPLIVYLEKRIVRFVKSFRNNEGNYNEKNV